MGFISCTFQFGNRPGSVIGASAHATNTLANISPPTSHIIFFIISITSVQERQQFRVVLHRVPQGGADHFSATEVKWGKVLAYITRTFPHPSVVLFFVVVGSVR
jgi:hypothetical protein